MKQLISYFTIKNAILNISLVVLMSIPFKGLTQSKSSSSNREPEKRNNFSSAVQVQGYPTGWMAKLTEEFRFNGKNALVISAGYNWFDHRSLGKHDHEKGHGFGFTTGYRRYLRDAGLKGFYVGAYTDFWRSRVNWAEFQDNDRKGLELIRSHSTISVVQPVFETGYEIRLANDRMTVTPSIGFGYEWNVSTNGARINIPVGLPENANLSKETGEGFIVLAGLSLMMDWHR